MSTEPIWIVDHDLEDHDIVQDIWRELDFRHELVLLTTAEAAFDRLEKSQKAPFIIICEVNLHGERSGFDFRRRLLETHSKKFKSVPFIFWSSHATEEQITEAYNLSVHGFFIKEGSFNDLKDTFLTIVRYWQKSRMPAKMEASIRT
jgi:DNA-binding NarL/FixJ family response regulator